MTATVSPPDHPATPRREISRATPRRGSPYEQTSLFGTSFWLAYAGNTSLAITVSLLFRYSDFVHVLGGSELQLGWIVGAGAVGSLLMRLAQGVGIDRYGPRTIWLGSLLLVIVTLLAHLLIDRVDRPGIYLVRMAYHTGIAGAFGASITYISLRASIVRMAERIGMLGSSGFLGMIVGTQLGDWLCRAPELERWHLDRLFLVAAGLATCALGFACAATRDEVRPISRRRVPIWWLIRRYQPGALLLMAVMTGVGVGLPGTFVRPFCSALGIPTIGVFFGIYAVTAFITRVAARRLPERIGIPATILLGMASLVASMFLYLGVHRAWQLVLPGMAAGAAHALLFPPIVAGGSRTFPIRYRGLGTTLVLSMFDLGNLVGMPLAGSIIYVAHRAGLAPYGVMYVSIAAL